MLSDTPTGAYWKDKSLKGFLVVASVHSYNTRLASKSTYYINTIKTN